MRRMRRWMISFGECLGKIDTTLGNSLKANVWFGNLVCKLNR